MKRTDVPPGGREVDFAPAPVVLFGFRNRWRETNWCAKAWNTLDPSFGLHATLLNFEDSNMELGIGASVTFLNDFVSLGYGVNLQADDGSDYYFIGLGLFEILNTMRGQF